ncbi:hypothetical protein [Vibrio phage S4-7]|nr:hypothetical protein [Vibrio phage S4-7]
MLKVVVFNGPPRSGKGIIAKHLTENINSMDNNVPAFHMEFKDELFKICANFLGKSVGSFLSNYDARCEDVINPSHLERIPEWYKDYTGTIGQRVVNTQYSKREFLIHVSENVIKPSFGDQAFGNALANNLPKDGYVFISDSGFKDELQPVIDHVGASNVLVVRINRDGCTFEGDSRDYLEPEMFNNEVLFMDVSNNKTEEQFLTMTTIKVGGWLNE